MAATFKKIEFEGLDIRATKGDLPARWAVSGRPYPVEIDGVLRGFLAFHRAQYGRGAQWHAYRLVSANWRKTDEPPNQWPEKIGLSGYNPEEALRYLGRTANQGALPSLDERDAWIATSRARLAEEATIEAAKNAAHEAERAAWKAQAAREAQERQEAADRARSEIFDALTSIRDRASVAPVLLTNFEVDVLGRLIASHSPKEVPTDAPA